MSRAAEIAQEIAHYMPAIARRIILGFFQSTEITPSQMFVILFLSENKENRLSDVSRALRISAPTVTGVIDRLEKSGAVKRIPSHEDRRVIFLELTPKGKSIARKFRTTIKNRWQDILAKLRPEEGEQYLRIIKKIHRLI